MPVVSYTTVVPPYYVPPLATGTFTVTWTAPETDADASAVSTVTSHKVYWSTDPLARENAANSVSVAMPTLTYLLTGLLITPHYVWVAAVSADGESDVSPPKQFTPTPL